METNDLGTLLALLGLSATFGTPLLFDRNRKLCAVAAAVFLVWALWILLGTSARDYPSATVLAGSVIGFVSVELVRRHRRTEGRSRISELEALLSEQRRKRISAIRAAVSAYCCGLRHRDQRLDEIRSISVATRMLFEHYSDESERQPDRRLYAAWHAIQRLSSDSFQGEIERNWTILEPHVRSIAALGELEWVLDIASKIVGPDH